MHYPNLSWRKDSITFPISPCPHFPTPNTSIQRFLISAGWTQGRCQTEASTETIAPPGWGKPGPLHSLLQQRRCNVPSPPVWCVYWYLQCSHMCRCPCVHIQKCVCPRVGGGRRGEAEGPSLGKSSQPHSAGESTGTTGNVIVRNILHLPFLNLFPGCSFFFWLCHVSYKILVP